ncbi:MAG: hypothetical protein ACXVLQ_14000, partial [Bacteriovorax sp.]
MKLKTSPLFSLNLYCKILILAGLTTIPGRAFSQNQENPGVIESLERLLEVHRKQYDQNKSKTQSNLQALTNLSELKEIKLD